MCYNCGCGIADDDMGHQDNITNQTFGLLAKKLNKSLLDTKKLVYDYIADSSTLSGEEEVAVDQMFSKASLAWGQSVDEAKKEVAHMLKREVA